ncbi:hypothetical protein SDC9_156908 [bioreactor metagenome]|uniref:Uncharacterized protein n=1 Tax=bioreactor metagenome TaxID=1076179 RepID=A0A645F5Z7_9ZZZZ
MDRIARHTQARRALRAHGAPLEIIALAPHPGQHVPALGVVTHRAAHAAGADTDRDPVRYDDARSVHPWPLPFILFPAPTGTAAVDWISGV